MQPTTKENGIPKPLKPTFSGLHRSVTLSARKEACGPSPPERRRSIAVAPSPGLVPESEKRRRGRLSLANHASFSEILSPRYERTKKRVGSEVKEAMLLSRCIKDQLAELSSPITIQRRLLDDDIDELELLEL